jgi:hypothetical protein
MFHYPLFVVSPAVEICRRMSNGPSRCRNSLNYVETLRKLLMRWRKARNTQKLSNKGSPRPATASHNGAGTSRPPKLVSYGLCGLRSELPRPKAKSGDDPPVARRVGRKSSPLSKAQGPISPALGGKNKRFPPHRLRWPKPKLPLIIVRHVSPTPALPALNRRPSIGRCSSTLVRGDLASGGGFQRVYVRPGSTSRQNLGETV